MKAMVLAAGQGTRLRPLTNGVPKALVLVAGRPMIDYPLLLLKHYGIENIIINLHYLGDQIETYLGAGDRFGLKITYSREEDLLDTGGGLLRAKPFLQDGTFIVINTDVLIDLPLSEVLKFHALKQASASLVLRPDAAARQYGSMDISSDGRICRFLQTPAPQIGTAATRELMFTGVQVLEPKIFEFMDPDQERKFSTTRETYPRMLSAGEPLYGFCFNGFWQDLGTAERIKEAEQRLASGRARLHYLPG